MILMTVKFLTLQVGRTQHPMARFLSSLANLLHQFADRLDYRAISRRTRANLHRA